MRLYLAGPSAELGRVREAAALIEAAGHSITCRWFDVIEADRQGRPTDAGTADAVLARAWAENISGVWAAEAVIALAKSEGGLSNGTREEVAWAVAHEIVVHVVGDPGASPMVGALRSKWLVVPDLATALGLLGKVVGR